MKFRVSRVLATVLVVKGDLQTRVRVITRRSAVLSTSVRDPWIGKCTGEPATRIFVTRREIVWKVIKIYSFVRFAGPPGDELDKKEEKVARTNRGESFFYALNH